MSGGPDAADVRQGTLAKPSVLSRHGIKGETVKGEAVMDKEHIKGAVDKTKGAMKDAAGGLTGDAKLQAEGKLDKMKGAVHQAAGDVKDAAKDVKKEANKEAQKH